MQISNYTSESQLPEIIKLIEKDLSEPYCIYTYRYFLHNHPELCKVATVDGEIIGCIIGKMDNGRGYIGMLAVSDNHRKKGVAQSLFQALMEEMSKSCHEAVLETEVTNTAAINFYLKNGFIKDKLLLRYYLNGVDAFRLKLMM